MRRMAFILALMLIPFAVFADDHPWDIAIDVGKEGINPTIDPPKPVAKIGEDDILAVQILSDGKRPAENQAQLRFTQPVREIQQSQGLKILSLRTTKGNGPSPDFTLTGTSHLLRFKKCTDKLFSGLTFADTHQPVTSADCPLIVSSGTNTVTIYANTDAIGVIAEVDQAASPTFLQPLRATATIRTTRPYWNLQYSGGLSFFSGSNLRDETYTIKPNADETKPGEIVSTGRGEAAYEFGLFATYMMHRPKQIPFGLTFGVSTKVPVDELTGIAGVSVRIKPFLLVDSAFVTAGIAYRGHQRLLPKYRKDMIAPAGVTETDIVGTEHDVGLVFAVHFGFGGNADQFKSVVSGNNGDDNQ